MTAKKMNVLVYSGNGSTIESVRHCLYSLRRSLSPNYAVIPVTDSIILKEPWTASCALLVFPGGADLGYCRSLNGEGNRRISQYVRRGGSYLGFCAGGYYGSSRCEFEVGDKKLEVIGPRELGFFPGTCRGSAFRGFVYHSEVGTRAAMLEVKGGAFRSGLVPKGFRSYYNGGGVFFDAGKFKEKGVEVIASYAESLDVEGGEDAAAIVYCKFGEGHVILTGPHPEFAAANLDPNAAIPGYSDIVKALAEDDEPRSQFLRDCLLKLGLLVNEETTSIPSLSRLHLSSSDHQSVSELLDSWKDIITKEDGEEYIKCENDTFHIEQKSTRWSFGSLAAKMPGIGPRSDEKSTNGTVESQDKIIDYTQMTKHLIPHESEWPATKETPYFNHFAYYANLKKYQEEQTSEAEEFGKYLLYGEVVTSTSTLLEKNTKLLSHLPHGFAFTATTQVAGRGRGSNVWVSPRGVTMFSVVLKHPMHLMNTAPIVFIQYLAAIATVEAIHTYDHGYQNLPVKLKWPNDIYALDPTTSTPNTYVKIGGILVTTSFSSGAYDLVLGLGLNVSNPLPTTCLNTLLPTHLAPFTPEKLLARILTTFENIYMSFCRTGFDRALEETYYRYWLHTDQIVTLEAEGGVRARLRGITRDWGLLRVEECVEGGKGTGRFWELQSDCNSFDFFKGLVRRKV